MVAVLERKRKDSSEEMELLRFTDFGFVRNYTCTLSKVKKRLGRLCP
ncbi:hypothetical protein HNR44_003072 [Geomicrobium halophilum]|uniref:Uncharacterized protein n=1 Tax=Geomicrobium halophilum TaxID=549000 RepID=A0A841Q2Q0_9BACL|nr:hypothetical protein [Geomicrobium halophilum]